MNKNKDILSSSVLFFLMFFAIGLYTPILSLYLKDILQFSGTQTGLIMSLVLVSSLLSPLISSLIIDRVVTKKWMLFTCSISSSILSFGLAYCKTYMAFMLCYVFYVIVFSPILGLLTALILDKIDDKGKFGRVRLCGTIGWILASMFFGFFWIKKFGYESLGQCFIITGISLFCFSLFSLTIKDKKSIEVSSVKKKNILQIIVPTGAVKALSKPKLRIVLALFFLAYFIESINLFGASPFLKQIGFDPSLIMPILTLGQAMEIISLFMLSYLLQKVGTKSIFRISLICQICALFLFTFLGHMKIFIYFGLIFQGVKIGLLIPAITIYIDSHCDSENRGAVHQLLSLITGLSFFIGNNIAGWIMDFTTKGTEVNFLIFWTIPLITAVIFLFLTELFFKNTLGSRSTNDLSLNCTQITDKAG